MHRRTFASAAVVLVACAAASAQTPVGTSFTYQGQLQFNGLPVNSPADFIFRLFDADDGGTQIGADVGVPNAALSNGLFTVQLDFGASPFGGECRWLDIQVRSPAGGGGYTQLSPRQELTPVPYASFSTAPWATGIGGSLSYNNGNVGIGTISPGQKLSVAGTVESTSGGFKFPDGTTQTTAGASAWHLSGNAGTTPGTDFIGTTDNQALEAKVNNTRVLRLEPAGTCSNVIAGSHFNSATTGVYGATIGGGGSDSDPNSANRVTDVGGTVAGGAQNVAGNSAGTTSDVIYATVGGGLWNTASANVATVGGGWHNTASGSDGTVGGGSANTASGVRATVGGGFSNTALGQCATVGGGNGNMAPADTATVGGGYHNTASGIDATVGGGTTNTASGLRATVGGGYSNMASVASYYATVGGGLYNTASGAYATVGGGSTNTASAEGATVGGGDQNTASGLWATVGGGSANVASGLWATVPGGFYNVAGGKYSFAAGYTAHVRTPSETGDYDGDQGTFVWADAIGTTFTSTGTNRFMVRATGGTYIYSNSALTSGVTLAAGASAWSSVSDRAAKDNFASVPGRELLDKLADVPVETWNYRSQDPAIRHIGPMAQDFHAAFGVGEDEKTISTVDADGVALAGVQALYQLAKEQSEEIACLKEQNARLEAAVARLLDESKGGRP
jgi:trimeric autotransporter adhesin